MSEETLSRPGSGSELWAMSLAAIAVTMEADNVNNVWELGGWPDNENRQSWARFVLKKLYDIETREQLLNAVEYFSQQGQNAEMQEALANLPDDPTGDNYCQRLLRDNAESIQRGGAVGWDIARATCIAGWAVLGRLIPLVEYWQLMKPMAERAQETYSSWKEYAEGYKLGRDYWAEGAEHPLTTKTIERLLTDPDSSWVKMQWNTSLDWIPLPGHVPGENYRREQAAATQQNSNDNDPEIFPGQPLGRLSDYVNVMRMAQSGQMMQAMQTSGLDMMTYSQAMQRWGQKMATDPALAIKFSQLLSGTNK